MKTKFNIDILGESPLLDDFTRMVAKHNSGKINIDLNVFKGYVAGKKAAYDTVYGHIVVQEETGAIFILENDKPTITITEIELHELKN